MNYSKVWNVMNDLEMVTCKIASAREILDSAMDRLQEHQYDKTETLLCAVDEFLQYYLAEFDTKFKDAWKETVLQLKEDVNDETLTHDEMIAKGYTMTADGFWINEKVESTPYYGKGATSHSSHYYDYDRNKRRPCYHNTRKMSSPRHKTSQPHPITHRNPQFYHTQGLKVNPPTHNTY
jgi:hypothetical protein